MPLHVLMRARAVSTASLIALVTLSTEELLIVLTPTVAHKNQPPHQMTDAEKKDFSAENVRKIMPSSQRKSVEQHIKTFKQQCVQAVTQAAQHDRNSAIVTLELFSTGNVANASEIISNTILWLESCGFEADEPLKKPFSVEISWREKEEEEEVEEEVEEEEEQTKEQPSLAPNSLFEWGSVNKTAARRLKTVN